MSITVLIPCLNEENYIEDCVTSLINNNKEIDFDILIIDGKSVDGTIPILNKLASNFSNVKWIENTRRTVPYALNLGILQSPSEFIIRVDAHCTYPLDYIATLVEHMSDPSVANVGGGWSSRPGAETAEAMVVCKVTADKFCVGNAQYRIGAEAPMFTDTVPFGCYRRSVFDDIGMFDEEMTRNQDDELNSRIVKNGGKILLLPNLEIIYFCRPTIKKAAVMFYQYALFKPLGNMKSGRISTVRQLAPPIFLLTLILLGLTSIFNFDAFPILMSVLTLYFAVIFARSLYLDYKFSKKNFSAERIFLSIKCFSAIHLSYGIGYFVGILGIFLRMFTKFNFFNVGSSR